VTRTRPAPTTAATSARTGWCLPPKGEFLVRFPGKELSSFSLTAVHVVLGAPATSATLRQRATLARRCHAAVVVAGARAAAAAHRKPWSCFVLWRRHSLPAPRCCCWSALPPAPPPAFRVSTALDRCSAASPRDTAPRYHHRRPPSFLTAALSRRLRQRQRITAVELIVSRPLDEDFCTARRPHRRPAVVSAPPPRHHGNQPRSGSKQCCRGWHPPHRRRRRLSPFPAGLRRPPPNAHATTAAITLSPLPVVSRRLPLARANCARHVATAPGVVP